MDKEGQTIIVSNLHAESAGTTKNLGDSKKAPIMAGFALIAVLRLSDGLWIFTLFGIDFGNLWTKMSINIFCQQSLYCPHPHQ